MRNYGKHHRLNRFFGNADKKILVLAMDHGIPNGDARGLENIEGLIEKVYSNVDAVILNKGMINTIADSTLNKVGLIYKLNGITSRAPNPYDLVMFTNIEEALSYDPVAVSYELYIGAEQEQRRLEELSRIIREANKFDMPVISHIYPNAEKKDPEIISHCIRLGWEIGSDVIKTFYFKGMKEQINRTPKPVIIAGGEKMSNQSDVVAYVSSAMQEDAKGIAIGRNLWGWGDQSADLIRKVSKIVHT
jgi:class I fructose-bisphosphate aldolase